MPATAGFAAVGCVQQNVINSALRVAAANFAPPYAVSLPSVIVIGGSPVSISGVLALTAPQVTLQTRADNLVSVSVGFAGQLSLSSSGLSAFTEVLLSASVLVGLVSQTSTSGNTQQITVGIDLSQASITVVEVTVLAGPPLAVIFNGALTSTSALAALTAALRAVPASLTEVTPQGINLPLQVIQTYQPPEGSLFSPNTLFQMQFAVSRIVARPLTSNVGNSGVLVVAVDVSEPVATTGDATALVDLTSPVPVDLTIAYGNEGAVEFSSGGGEAQQTCGVALYISSSWIAAVLGGVLAPQLAGKFLPQLAANNVSFTNTPDCLQVSFGDVTAALNNPLSPPIPTGVLIPGITLNVKMTRWVGVDVDGLGYYHGKSGIGVVDAGFSAQIVLLLIQNGSTQQPRPTPPLLTNDAYGAFVIGTNISLPWWIDITAIFALGPAYLLGTLVAGMFGVDIFYPTIVSNANTSAGQGLQSSLGGLFQGQASQLVAQLPGTSKPDWYLSVVSLGTSSDACFSCVNLNLLPPGLGSGTGSFPYLMLTDQPVTNPNTVPDTSGSPFPVRFDGSFNWPGIAYNQPGYGALGGGYAWDLHDTNPIGVVLKIPTGLFSPADPTVLVSWTIIRTDTNAQLLARTSAIGSPGALAVSIDHASAGLQAADGFRINCTIFRQLAGGGTEQIFNSGNVNVSIADHFDRRHPYATWSAHVKYVYPGEPFWNAIPAKAHVPGRRWVKTERASRIHRTDWWSGGHRCLVADTSGLMGDPPRKHPTLRNEGQVARGIDDFTYLDTLPVSLADVARDRDLARGVLCDYCFFGGPTKTTLRTDFP